MSEGAEVTLALDEQCELELQKNKIKLKKT